MSFLCALPLIAALAGNCPIAPLSVVGYVEGDTILVAPLEIAEITSLTVRRGDRVKAGQLIAGMEKRDANIALAQAQAARASAEAKLANLKLGKRPEELAAIEASLNSAKAQQEEAQSTLHRRAELLDRGVTSKADYDSVAASAATADAKVKEAEANLAAARLPAREEEIKSAAASVSEAQAGEAAAAFKLEKRDITAPSDGLVSDIIRNHGEVAGPQAPILSLLPDGAIKLRFYVPQGWVGSLQLGEKVPLSCDGCAPLPPVVVSYIASDPEFTPPVIYSRDSRQKLVYLVEARPEGVSTALRPGQIVDLDFTGLLPAGIGAQP